MSKKPIIVETGLVKCLYSCSSALVTLYEDHVYRYEIYAESPNNFLHRIKVYNGNAENDYVLFENSHFNTNFITLKELRTQKLKKINNITI